MAVTKKQATGRNNTAKEGGKGTGKKAASSKAVMKKDVQTKKGSGRIVAARGYITGVLNELKKVHWPNRRETSIYTVVVFVAVLVVAVLIWVFDSLLSWVVQFIY